MYNKKNNMIKNIKKLMSNCKNTPIQTPTIFYFANVIDDNIASIRNISAVRRFKSFKIFYSIKANNFIPLIEYVSSRVDGLDVAARSEYNILTNKTTLQEPLISATGYAYSSMEISNIISDGNSFDFSTFSQIDDVFSTQKFKNLKIGIRINTIQSSLEEQGEEDSTSRFGFQIKDIDKIKKLQDKYKFIIDTLHIHGGQKSLSSLQKDIHVIKKWLLSDCGKNIHKLNFGGSWDYLADNNQMESAFNLIANNFSQYSLIIEPGSLLVRTSGILVSTVLDSETNGVLVDASQFNLSSWFKPKIIGSTSNSKNIVSCRINGITCYENDTFGNYTGKQLTIGDKMLFYPVGAYYVTTRRNLHNLSFPEQFLV